MRVLKGEGCSTPGAFDTELETCFTYINEDSMATGNYYSQWRESNVTGEDSYKYREFLYQDVDAGYSINSK